MILLWLEAHTFVLKWKNGQSTTINSNLIALQTEDITIQQTQVRQEAKN